MRANFLPCPRLASTFLHNPFILIAGALAWLSPLALSAQSVSFAGASPSVNFGNVNLCPAGQTTPAPCSETLTLTYNVTAGGTLGTPKVVTQGAPNLDFTLAGGSTCSGEVTEGNTCSVNVKFVPRYAGGRTGGVLVTDAGGNVLATTLIYGFGVGPQIGFDSGIPAPLADGFSLIYQMAVDGLGDVFVVDYSYQVTEIPAGGGSLRTITPSADGPILTGVAVDGAGDLFVVDIQNSQVYELPAGGGAQITVPFTGLLNPLEVAVDGAGDVFVTDYNHGRVEELPTSGAQKTVTPEPLVYPEGVASDVAGDSFVSTFNVADTVGIVLEEPAGGGPQITVDGELPPAACGLAVDGIGDLFVADYQPFILKFPLGGGTPTQVSSGLIQPSAVAVDGAGNLLIGEFLPPNSTSSGLVVLLMRSQPPALNFGAIAFGNTATLPLTVTNTGTGTLTLAPSINEPSYKIASMSPDNCVAGITAGQICTLQIEFNPATGGGFNGLLTLQTNAATSPTVSLQGSAVVNTPVFSPPSGVYATAQTVSITDPGAKIYYTTNGTVPTASSTPYTGAISVNSTETLTAIAFVNVPSALATATYTIASGTSSNVLNFGQGFAGAEGPIQFNGSTDLPGSRLQLTNGTHYQAGSAFYATPVNIRSFTTDFTFQLSNPIADGFTFTIQNIGASALGAYGEALGYAPIGKSVAIKFDLHNNSGEGPNSTGLYVDGAAPTVPAVDLTATGIDLHSGHVFFAQVTYDGTNLVLTLTDTVTFASWSHSFGINIPATVGGDTAYIGFTGGSGIDTANQEILSWTYVSGPPGPPAPPPPIPSAPDYPAGFNAVGLATNGNAALSGSALQLTDGGPDEAGSAFYAIPVPIDQSFTADFTFQLLSPTASVPLANIADGITFTILNAEPYVVAAGDTALGGLGGALGFTGIVNNVSGGYNNFDMAIKFDLHNNSGEGPNSTGLYANGAPPTTPAIDLSGTGIDLHSGHPFQAQVVYDYAATSLSLTLTDTITLATWSHSFTIDIPKTIGGVTAYVGFTGATGFDVAVQQILNWTFTTP